MNKQEECKRNYFRKPHGQRSLLNFFKYENTPTNPTKSFVRKEMVLPLVKRQNKSSLNSSKTQNASLFIDRLKNEFQKRDCFIRRTKPSESWHPKFSLTYFCTDQFKNSEEPPEEAESKSFPKNFVAEKPYVFSIGLPCNDSIHRESRTNHRAWSMVDLTKNLNYFKQRNNRREIRLQDRNRYIFKYKNDPRVQSSSRSRRFKGTKENKEGKRFESGKVSRITEARGTTDISALRDKTKRSSSTNSNRPGNDFKSTMVGSICTAESGEEEFPENCILFETIKRLDHSRSENNFTDIPLDRITSETLILENIKRRIEREFDNSFTDDQQGTLDDDLTNLSQDLMTLMMIDGNEGLFIDGRNSSATSSNLEESYIAMTNTRSENFKSLLSPSSKFANWNPIKRRTSSFTEIEPEDFSAFGSSIGHSTSNITTSSMFDSLDNALQASSSCSRKSKESKLSCLSSKSPLEDSWRNSSWEESRKNSFRKWHSPCLRNSTPSVDVSSKRIRKSIDSGISSDDSRVRLTNSDLSNRSSYSRELDLLPIFDFSSDSSHSDESLDRTVDRVVKKFTERLILCERRAKIRSNENLEKQQRICRQARRSARIFFSVKVNGSTNNTCTLTPTRSFSDDERVSGISTPSLMSSDSEVDGS